jgi:hypothetical protein
MCAAASMILLGALPASSLAVPALAQTASKPPLVCLVREGLPGNDPLHIVAPASDAAALKAKGFVAADCGDAAFSRDRQIALRDRMCRIAADEPEGTTRLQAPSLTHLWPFPRAKRRGTARFLPMILERKILVIQEFTVWCATQSGANPSQLAEWRKFPVFDAPMPARAGVLSH